jgi:hypothetical protein
MVQKCDREFFQNHRTIAGPIPVIAVFTQYDKLVKEVRDDYVGRNWDRIMAGEIPRITQIHEIRQLIKHKSEVMKREWEKVIPPIGIGTVYLSNPPSDILSSNPGLIGESSFITFKVEIVWRFSSHLYTIHTDLDICRSL